MTARRLRRGQMLARGTTIAMTPALLALQVLAAPGAAAASDGVLDRRFGTGGVVRVSFPGGFTTATEMALLADGRSYVGGTAAGRFAVARFTRSGALDPTFGDGDGVADVDPDGSGVERLADVEVQDDGKVLLSGESILPGGVSRIVVTRLTGTGAVDGSFGSAGTALVDLGPGTSELGGKLAVLPAGVVGGQRILVAGWDEGPTATVVRLTPSGSPDLTFGSFGRSVINMGAPTTVDDLEYLAATDRIHVSGRVRNGASSGGTTLDQAWVGRITGAGSPDASFAGDGTLAWSPSGGTAHDAAQAIVFAADGRLGAVGTSQTATAPVTSRGAVSEITAGGAVAGGARHASGLFGSSDTSASIASAAYDAVGRLFVVGAGSTSGSRFGVARVTDARGALDPAFVGSRGGEAPACATGGATAVTVDVAGRVLVAGHCDGALTLVRYLADNGAGPVLANLAFSVAPAERSVQRLQLPISSLDRSKIMPTAEHLVGTPLNSSPLNSSPLNSSIAAIPLNSSPLNSSPLNSSPLNSSPLNSSVLPATLLSEIPLIDVPGGWEAVLAGTPLEGLPLQSITLAQVLALDPLPPSVQLLTLAHIPLNSSPLNSSSLAAVLFGLTPLNGFPAPQNGWCAFLAAQPFNCSNGVDIAKTTLAELESRGDKLGAYYAIPLPLRQVSLPADSPLATIRLARIDLASTPIGGLTYAQAPDFFSCPVTGCAPTTTLAAAQSSQGAPDVDGTRDIGDLLATALLPELTFGQVLPGLLPADDFPYQDVPLADLLALAPRDGEVASYTTAFDVDCPRSENLTIDVDLPATARLVVGSSRIDLGAGATEVTPSSDEPGGVSYAVSPDGPACTNPAAGARRRATLTFDAVVPSVLGVDDSTVDVTTALDPEGVSATGAVIRTVDPTEPANDDAGTAPTISRDVLYSGHIGHATDVDWVSFPAPAVGSTATLFLSHLPADYDVYLFGAAQPEARPAPLNSSPLNSSPLNSSIVGDVADSSAGDGFAVPSDSIQDSPLNSSPLNSSPLNSSPLNSSALRDSGTRRGTADEVVRLTATEADAGQPVVAAIVSYNGTTEAEPYVVRLKIDDAFGELPCITRSITGGTPGTLPSVAATTQTLFLVNEQRFGAVYGPEATATMMSALRSVAGRAEVQGAVLPVEADPDVALAYRRWDGATPGDPGPCSIQAANDVVSSINALVNDVSAPLAELRHIVLVGADHMIPMGRVQDLTLLSNQRDYARDVAFAGRDNAISRAFLRQFMLTDDVYGDYDPQRWLGGRLYVPDVGLGRLVETPQEITAALDRYVAADGRLQTGSSYVAGYDFLADGSTDVADVVQARTPGSTHRRDIREDWTAADARSALNASPRTISINAHHDHFRALPARENAHPGLASPQLLTSTDLLAASVAPGGVLFTVGCNAGVNVADVAVVMPGQTLTAGDAARVRDWMQVAAQKGIAAVANTGYGYGDTEVVGYSERLYVELAKALDGTATAGQAAALAKSRFIATGGPLSVYDAKAVQEATFYGLPFLRVGATGVTAPPFLPQAVGTEPGLITTAATAFDVTPNLVATATPRGTYYTVGSELPQVTQHRPVTARTTLDVTPTDGLTVKSPWFTRVQTKDVANADPVISVPAIGAARNEPEPRIADVAFPATLAVTSTTPTVAGRRTSLTLLPNQYFSDPQFGPGRGVQRLYTRLAGTVVRSDSVDFIAPQIVMAEGFTVGQTATFRARVPAPDTAEVMVHFIDDNMPAQPDGSVLWRTASLVDVGGGLWAGSGLISAGATEVKQFFVQARDRAGNAGLNNNKLRFFRAPAIAGGEKIVFTITPGPDTSGFHTTNPTVAVTPIVPGVVVETSIDGGTWNRYTQPFVVSGDGGHTILVRGSDGSTGGTGILIDTGAPVATITVPAEGQVFEIGQVVTPQFSCADAGSGVASCQALDGTTLDTSEGGHSFRVRAIDRLGRETVVTRTFRAGWYAFEGFFAPVDNPPIVNQTTAGNTVPIKFRVLRDGVVQKSGAVIRSITSVATSCQTGAPIDDVEEVLPGGQDGLTYEDAQAHFQFAWRTTSSMRGCRTLTVTLADGLRRSAMFRLK